MPSATLFSRWTLVTALATCATALSGQGVFAVPGSPGWTQKLIGESHGGALLTLTVLPSIESASMRRGFHIEVHQDNALWASNDHRGRRAARYSLPPEHLYTLSVRHPMAYRKVIQLDTRGLNQQVQLDCLVDLILRTQTDTLTFEEELILDMPLSVVWFDTERNLFRHDPYLHSDGIERLRSLLTLRDSSLRDSAKQRDTH